MDTLRSWALGHAELSCTTVASVALSAAQPHLRPAAACRFARLEPNDRPPAPEERGNTARRKAGAVRQRSFYVPPSTINDDLEDDELEVAAAAAAASASACAGPTSSSLNAPRQQPGTSAAAGELQQDAGSKPNQQIQQQDTLLCQPDGSNPKSEGGQQDRPRVDWSLDETPAQVRPGLFIGSMLAERNRRQLRGNKITDILQVAEGLYPNHPLHFNYMNIQVQDSPMEDLVVHFPRCFEFIDAAIARKGNVLVHCAGGVSRSATIVLGYLMSRHDMSLEEALALLRGARPFANPNPGFVAQLRELEKLGADPSKWKGWRRVWAQMGGAAGEPSAPLPPPAAAPPPPLPGAGAAVLVDGFHQCMLSIPPPLDVPCPGDLPGELLALTELRLEDDGGSATAATAAVGGAASR